ncbi:hypothetical protein H4S06_002805 [Coemansia sp. BCRC 34490]|nr:hypothetical protein H4S06_002805 [Coemansia sp. BCRC 34490]
MVGDSKDNFLMMKGQAALYSSQGLLNGMLTLYRDRLVWNEVSSKCAYSALYPVFYFDPHHN